jgi:hypothetical protein
VNQETPLQIQDELIDRYCPGMPRHIRAEYRQRTLWATIRDVNGAYLYDSEDAPVYADGRPWEAS